MPSIFAGANNALRDLKKLKLFAPDEFARALYQEALVELKEIKAVTPFKTGALRASIAITEPQREGRRIFVVVSASMDYAFYVHEDLEAYHPHGQAKYIEQPLTESAPHMADRIAARIELNKAL